MAAARGPLGHMADPPPPSRSLPIRLPGRNRPVPGTGKTLLSSTAVASTFELAHGSAPRTSRQLARHHRRSRPQGSKTAEAARSDRATDDRTVYRGWPDGCAAVFVLMWRAPPLANDSLQRGRPDPAAAGATTAAAADGRHRAQRRRSHGLRRIPVGQNPSYVRVAPNGKFAYVANPCGAIAVLNEALDTVLRPHQIPRDSAPVHRVLRRTAGRRQLFNTRGSVHLVAFIDTITGTVTSAMPGGQPTPAVDRRPGRTCSGTDHNMVKRAAPTTTSLRGDYATS